jgi:aminoglycoside phosphotransferase
MAPLACATELPFDAGLPVAQHLVGAPARDLLASGIAANGGRLVDARVAQVQYRPGRSITVRYAATVQWGRADVVDETLLAGATTDGAPRGTLPLRFGELEAGLWRYPFDPVLVGLRDAVETPGLEQLVRPHTGAIVGVDVRTYRPTRRAVVHATGLRRDVYVKVVEPGATAQALIDRHELLARVLPVPTVVAADVDRGLVAISALPGDTLRAALVHHRGPWPGAGLFDDLAAALASVSPPPGAATVGGAVAALGTHARLLATVLPGERGRLDALVAAIEREGAPSADGASRSVMVHGDLHDGQVLVDGGRIVGLLDLDDIGPGDPLDDRARLLGHIATIALGCEARPAVTQYAADLFDLWSSDARDEEQLASRTAAAVLGLATGPFRVQQPDWPAATRERLALAERWMDVGPRHTRR